jgi:biopolymer transport protein TolR
VLRRNYLRPLVCRIDVSAFVAVMFAILFLMMPPYVEHPPHRGISVDLPKADNADDQKRANREDAMFLAVERDGTVFFQHEKTTPAKLPAMIREQVRQGSDRKVYVKADARARYGSVLDALNGVRASGVIDDIAFMTEPRRATLRTP